MNFLRLSQVWGQWVDLSSWADVKRRQNFAVTYPITYNKFYGPNGKKGSSSHGFHRKPAGAPEKQTQLERTTKLHTTTAQPLDRCPPTPKIIRWLIRPAGKFLFRVLTERSVGFDYGSDEAATYGLSTQISSKFLWFLRDVSGHSVHTKNHGITVEFL